MLCAFITPKKCDFAVLTAGYVGMPFPLVQARIVQQSEDTDAAPQILVEASDDTVRVTAGACERLHVSKKHFQTQVV